MIENLSPSWRHRIPRMCLALVVALMSVLGWAFWQYQKTLSSVEHTVDVKASISAVWESVQDGVAATQAYIIVGKPVFIESFQKAAGGLDARFAQLDSLIADNPAQRNSLNALKPIVYANFAKYLVAIELRGRLNVDETLEKMASPGDQSQQQMRELVDSMQQEESRLLARRLNAVSQSVIWVAALSVLMSIFVIASMITWIWIESDEARKSLANIAERDDQEGRIRQFQKVEAIGDLTGGLAHDFNNMLTVIVSGLNLAQNRLKAGDSNVQRFLDAAMDGATRAATLTSRLMAFARQQPLASARIDVNHLITGINDLLQSSLGQDIKVQMVLSSGLWSINADSGQLENAILNLAVNARDAMPGGGQLTIETANCDFDKAYARQNDMKEGQYVQIAVSDNGSGMTAEVASKAFDPFFTTKGVGKGTGLGLSQVHGFIKQSGGNIKIYSEDGQGTTIKMYLPRLQETGAKQDFDNARVEAWPNLTRDNSAHLILVVEDDPRVNEMTVSSLRELGYRVIHSDGASGALEQLGAHADVKLLFTDIVMPDVNGRQLAAEALRRRPGLKVLYTTGFAKNALLRTDKMNAKLNFIAKPFTLVQVAAKVTEVLATE